MSRAVMLTDLRLLEKERRDAIALELVSEMPGAACAGKGVWWSQIEREHAAARSVTRVREVVDPALALCAGCPAIVECDQLARVNHYYGLAAGMAWNNGRSSNPYQVKRKPQTSRDGEHAA